MNISEWIDRISKRRPARDEELVSENLRRRGKDRRELDLLAKVNRMIKPKRSQWVPF